MIKQKLNQFGLTLIELMIGISIAMILFLMTGVVFSNHNKTVKQYAQESITEQDAQLVYGMLSVLLKQAVICLTCTPQQTVSIVYNQGTHPMTAISQTNDELTLTLELPSGYKIWPNNVLNGEVYDRNLVQFHWNQSTGILEYKNAADTTVLGATAYSPLIVPGAKTTRITQLEIWPMADSTTPQATATAAPSGGYRLCVTTRGHLTDASYVNPLDQAGPLKNVRTAQICGIIYPRNW